MRLTFEELQVVVSTALLLPALIALILYAVGHRPEEHGDDGWDPRAMPERDWWSKEAR